MKVTNEQLAEKIDALTKIVERNSKDIVELYKIINIGKGGVRVLVWVGTIVIAILGWRLSQ
jgi:hypothetical protein|tara:strand:+ start:27 stop:209 length:183 start_codon:yes stop_codon:yes gene_type:complete